VGFIDSNDFTLTCPNAVLQKSASEAERLMVWCAMELPSNPDKFDATWDESARGPVIEAAKCRRFGFAASVVWG